MGPAAPTSASALPAPTPSSCRRCSVPVTRAPTRSGRPSQQPSARSMTPAAPDGWRRSSATIPRPRPPGCAGPAPWPTGDRPSGGSLRQARRTPMRTSVGKPPRARGNPLPGLPSSRTLRPENRSFSLTWARHSSYRTCDEKRTGFMTARMSRRSGRPSCWRFCAVATALKSRFHLVFVSSPGASGALSGAIRFGISEPVTASPSTRQVCSTAAGLNGRHRHNGLSSLAAVSPGVLE